jgi:RAB protein geranylgeranyltransferase component A
MYLYFGSSNKRNLKYSISSNHHSSKTNQKTEWYLIYYLDIYIMMVSSVHCVSKKDTYIAIISTTVETEKPEQ